jgi:predicted DCC family thiol-disulfide oxidoreductase YuxK
MPARVIYDAHCVLCNRTVAFLRRRARPGALEYVADPAPGQTTVVVVDDGIRYTKSDAVLHVVGRLRRPWPALRVLRVVPRALRDGVYDWVAANRYRWFGRCECAVPGTTPR